MRRVMGSPSGSRHDLREALELAAVHEIRADVTTIALEVANDAIARMREGRVSGHAVLKLA